MPLRSITSLQNPLVKHLVKIRKERKYRESCSSVIIEGKKLIGELVPGIAVKHLLATKPSLIPEGVSESVCYLVSHQILEKISGARSPEGIIAEVQMPQESAFDRFKKVVACDGVSDPGNLGTIIRTALALGWEGIYLLNNCCDPFNDKAIRAAKGATFRLPYRLGTEEDLAACIKKNNWRAISADLSGNHPGEFRSEEAILLILGSEAKGLSESIKTISCPVSIPMIARRCPWQTYRGDGVFKRLCCGSDLNVFTFK